MITPLIYITPGQAVGLIVAFIVYGIMLTFIWGINSPPKDFIILHILALCWVLGLFLIGVK